MINLDEEVFLTHIKQLIDQEISFINYSFSVQKKLYSNLLLYLQKISIDISANTCDKLRNGYKMLQKLLRHIDSFEKLLKTLEDMRGSISLTDYKISRDIKEYNTLVETTIKKINIDTFEIQHFIQSELITSANVPVIEEVPDFINSILENTATQLNTVDVHTEIVETGLNRAEAEDSVVETIDENPAPILPLDAPIKLSRVKIPSGMSFKNCKFLENTLVISELTKTVKLPYTIKELKTILRTSSGKYTSLREIVKKLYTKPLSNYKNSSSARFKEGYNLIRKKDGGSVKEAISLGFELFSNYNIHPAIITACKDLNQLDVYLSCLEYNELRDFPFFKVIFNVAPTLSKKAVVKKIATKRKKAAKQHAI